MESFLGMFESAFLDMPLPHLWREEARRHAKFGFDWLCFDAAIGHVCCRENQRRTFRRGGFVDSGKRRASEFHLKSTVSLRQVHFSTADVAEIETCALRSLGGKLH